MSDSSSGSLSSTILAKTKTKITTKSKTKSNSATHSAKPAPEDDPTWAYQPPEGLALIEDAEVHEGWDWDTFKKDPDLELWLIRVPSGVKPKHLENLTIELPRSSSNRNVKVGVLNRKQETYDVWNVGSSSPGSDNIGGVEVGRTDNEPVAGGEEMKGLHCLLPKKKKRGELYLAPKPITRQLIISAQPPQPSSNSSEDSIPIQNPPRFSYPQELLKHRFVAFGSTNAAINDDSNADDVHSDDDDIEMHDVHIKLDKHVKESVEKEPKQSKEMKKRKTVEEVAISSPKKQKKLKK